jgi:hypothetical protein
MTDANEVGQIVERVVTQVLQGHLSQIREELVRRVLEELRGPKQYKYRDFKYKVEMRIGKKGQDRVKIGARREGMAMKWKEKWDESISFRE